ncbi:radical SAM protein [Heliobacterium gestii]|uniref:Radical SAM protein n=1 Tax=Heliomicrobium gestii TaxID=2699 RepID=A0A845LKJ1_HELGE|nr:radical SAM protein [Heliomicrobium gestii]MBM7868178.1 radical SAM protein with 4Fe4S-binding SPASM domain [Heliomicrobium gestii]MZP43376.1 radical SAM protein [Heliomicrobium gestii]
MLLQWHITERCNWRCAHCYQADSAPAGEDELSPHEWPGVIAQFKALLTELSRRQGRPVGGQITVTGGEPFIHPAFMDLLALLAAEKAHFRFAILTNGSCVDNAMARALRRLEPLFVQVSLEGSRERHETIRGAGTYDQAVAALESLVRHGVRAFISFTAHRGNYRDFPEVAELGRRLKVDKVWADRLIPFGRGEGLAEASLTPEETRAFFEIMAGARRKAERSWFQRNRTVVAMDRALQFLSGGGKPYRCTAGKSLLCLLPDGGVTPCRRLPLMAGNLRQAALTEIYLRAPLLEKLRAPTQGAPDCGGCLFRRACDGGLRCLAYATKGDPFARDPGCWMA